MPDDLWDEETLALRGQWHQTKGTPEHQEVETRMQKALWKKRCAIVEEDRRRNPRAKRNQVYVGPKFPD